MEKLHPGAKWIFRISGYFSFFIVLMIFGWFLFPVIGFLGFLFSQNSSSQIIFTIIFGLVIYIVAIIVLAEIYAKMAYKRWLYEFTPNSLKLERGIIWKKYSNIPYERVQNVDITRGILARLLGFSTLDIQTAGFSGGYGRRGMPRSEGHIPAVSTQAAEKIREFLMKKITHKITSKQGL